MIFTCTIKFYSHHIVYNSLKSLPGGKLLTILRYLTEFLRIVMRKITMTAMIASNADDVIFLFLDVIYF